MSLFYLPATEETKMNGFRKHFVYPNLSYINWFPGHMARGMRDMGKQLQYCDCLLEVHDARIPLSGRNPRLNLLLGGRQKILVLNKMDLADKARIPSMLKSLDALGEKDVVFTNFYKQHNRSISELMDKIEEVVHFQRDFSEKEHPVNLMVIGMPNVGKSSLINALRRNYLKKGKATKVGKLPGVTRAVMNKILVCENPKVFLVDTPGVMMPNIMSDEVAMKLALTGTLLDHLVGEKIIADYLLFVLNQQQQFKYVTHYDLKEPCDDIYDCLDGICKRIGALSKGGELDHLRGAKHFIQCYRAGRLGRIMLDQETSNTEDSVDSAQPVQFLYPGSS